MTRETPEMMTTHHLFSWIQQQPCFNNTFHFSTFSLLTRFSELPFLWLDWNLYPRPPLSSTILTDALSKWLPLNICHNYWKKLFWNLTKKTSNCRVCVLCQIWCSGGRRCLPVDLLPFSNCLGVKNIWKLLSLFIYCIMGPSKYNIVTSLSLFI